MKIKLSSVMVDDQEKARLFYTRVLGFKVKNDIPMGDARWLTLVSPDGPDDIELLLEPTAFPPARTYQQALFDARIPLTAFEVDDIQAEYQRMNTLGVKFRSEPVESGPVISVLFEDTCGNLIQIYEI